MEHLVEPKTGCDIICEADVDFGKSREVQVYSIRRPRMRPGWCITSDGVFVADVSDWNGVTDFLKNIRAKDIEQCEV